MSSAASTTSTYTAGSSSTSSSSKSSLTYSHPAPQSKRPSSGPHSRPTTQWTSSASNIAQTSTGGIRAQLHHLLPRHALFHVRVKIHQISNIPLVQGEFGVRWKFKNVHSLPGARSKLFGRSHHGKGKGKEKAEDEHSDDDDEARDGSGETSPEDSNTIYSRDDHTGPPSLTFSGDGQSTRSTSISSSNPYAQYLTADWLPSSALAAGSPVSQASFADTRSLSSTTPVEAYAHARGMTDYVKLRDHSATWEHTVDVVVQIGVDRETSALQRNVLKLVVMQRVIHGDPDAPHNPRLGALYLNLEEYASSGSVTRRYLLRDTKFNATLKLTIQLEHIGGERSYKAPPLPRGEILNGIAGLLEDDVYRMRPKVLDLYGYGTPGNTIKPSSLSNKSSNPYSNNDNNMMPFDVSKLPLAYGPRTTESLIEAIFNPVPTSSAKESPFTYYVAPELKKDNDGGIAISVESAAPSVYSAESSSGVGYGSGGSVEDVGRVGWWKKIGSFSRPSTPVCT